VDKCLGFGGLGDCFITILKLLEYDRPFVYTHIDINKNRLALSMELLDHFGIEHNCYLVHDIRDYWAANHHKFDKCFNVFAKGYIDIPIRPYHWQPCKDEGYHNPFAPYTSPKIYQVAVQVNSSGPRTYKAKPIVQHVLDNYNEDEILWLGTDPEFDLEYGTNYCGKTTLMEALNLVAWSKRFVGFNSIMLYWALWHKTQCYLFTDHQDREDLRIHDEWKPYIEYDI
jgi:hypothetical protein